MAATLIVEDGSGLEVANSYVTQQEADDYWELRNDAQWAALADEAKVAAIVSAAQYLDYAYRWIGDRYSGLQMMSWPRYVTGWDADFRQMEAHIIPQRIKDAQCELAREAALNGPLMGALDRGGRVQQETVGNLSITYFGDAPGYKEFPLIDMILSDLTATSSYSSKAALG